MNMNKKTLTPTNMHLIFDLDETCISSVPTGDACGAHVDKLDKFNLYAEPGATQPEFTTYKRPYLDELLKWANENATVSVWSAGEKNYVLDIVKHLFSANPVHMILWREHCNASENATRCLKSIDWLQDKLPSLRDMSHPILIDDLADNCQPNKHHAINVRPFNAQDASSPNDTELLQLKNTLASIHAHALKESQPDLFWDV